jgi:hypothetical protein
VRIVQPGGDLDLSQESVSRHADQQLRMQDLQGYKAAPRLPGQKDAGIAAPPNLALDLVAPCECLAHQCQHVTPDGVLLQQMESMVANWTPAGKPQHL